MGFNDGFSTQGVPFVTGAAGGQVLTWDDTTSQWIAADPTGGGGGGTVETSGNITGSGTAFNKVRLKDDISLTSVTASFKGNLEGSASYANDADTLDGYQSSFFATTGSNIFYGNQEINGYVSASQGFTGSFSGSFIGDGSSLEGIVTSVGIDRIVYVQEGATPSGADGSITNPFATITAALLYASSSYSFSDPVVIEIGPGSYAENITIDRYNTYLRSRSTKSEQRQTKIVGNVSIQCSTAADTYNQVVGLEGLLISGTGTSPTISITGIGEHTTYIKGCYIYNISDSANVHGISINKNKDSKIAIQDCIINLSKITPLESSCVYINGGDVRIDSTIIYYKASGVGVSYGNGIKQTSDSITVSDRLLIELSGSGLRGYPIENSTTTAPTTPSFILSNSSITLTTAEIGWGSFNAEGSVNYLWNILLGPSNNIIKKHSSGGSAYVYYGSLSSAADITFGTTIVQIPLSERFGNVKSTSLSASSGITGSFNGNGAALTGILTSSVSNFASSVRSLFTGSGIISYNSSSGEISAPSAMTGVLTSGNITGSGVNGDAVSLKDTIELVGNLTASNAYIQNKLIVNGTASIAHLETLNQQSLVIGDKYIVILSGAADHVNLDGSGVLWGSGAVGDPTQGPEGENAYIRYKNSGDQLEIFPGLRVSGSLTASNGISSSAGFYGDGSNLTGVTASAFPGISNYPTKTEVSATFAIITGSNAFIGPSNSFTNIVTASGGITGSFTGSFKGDASQLTNLTGSGWSSTSAFFTDVRDTFIFDEASFITGAVINGRYPISASAGGGSSAGSVLTYASITGSGTITDGMIVAVSGTKIVAADNSDSIKSNIIGIVTDSGSLEFSVVIAGEVSASGLSTYNGGTVVYLSDTLGSYTTYANVSSGRYATQVGIVSPDNTKIILQPRIFGIKG